MCTIIGKDDEALRRARRERARRAELAAMTPQEREARKAKIARQAEAERKRRIEDEMLDFAWDFCMKKRGRR